MSKQPDAVSFEKMWSDAVSYGAGIEDLARELYQEMINAKVPLERIKSVLYILREIKCMDDYIPETYAEISMVKSLEKKLRTLIDNHTHEENGIACLPLENIETAKET